MSVLMDFDGLDCSSQAGISTSEGSESPRATPLPTESRPASPRHDAQPFVASDSIASDFVPTASPLDVQALPSSFQAENPAFDVFPLLVWCGAGLECSAAEGWGRGWTHGSTRYCADPQSLTNTFQMQHMQPEQPECSAVDGYPTSDGWHSGAWQTQQTSRNSTKWQRYRKPCTVSALLHAVAQDLESGLDGGRELTPILDKLDRLRELGLVRRLSCASAEWSRLIQRAVKQLSRKQAAPLMSHLQGSIAEAIQSPHANHVIEAALEALSHSEIPFVLDELSEADFAVCHQYGYRVFCKLMENIRGDTEQIGRLLDSQVFGRVSELIVDKYGHFVLEKLLEVGTGNQCRQAIRAIEPKLRELVHVLHDKTAAYFIAKVLAWEAEHCSQQSLTLELLSWGSVAMLDMACSASSSILARTLLRHAAGKIPKQQLDVLVAHRAYLFRTKDGQAVWRMAERQRRQAHGTQGGAASSRSSC